MISDNKVYLIGNRSNTPSNKVLQLTLMQENNNVECISKPNIIVSRFSHSICAYKDTQIAITGGRGLSNINSLSSCEVYDT